MTIDPKVSLKEYSLDRTIIRTMKKDLVRLREEDTRRESSKIAEFGDIGGSKNNSPSPKTSLKQGKVVAQNTTIVKNNPPQNLPREIDTSLDVKENASEIDKQKIFLYKSQKNELENQITTQAKEIPPILQEKNKLLASQRKWREKLAPLIEKEKNLSEDKTQSIEKQKWPIEREIKKTEDKVKEIDQTHRSLKEKENALKGKINTIDNSLRAISHQVKKSDNSLQEDIKKIQNPQRIADVGQKKPEAPIIKRTTQVNTKVSLKEVAPSVKNQLSQSVKIEDAQRIKFMEEVEKWANSSNH